ncbi:MAG: hypothetical protein RBU21_03735, partial [FCB group bacterium]|nr:hypothetical protein [FCB group bacterium]
MHLIALITLLAVSPLQVGTENQLLVDTRFFAESQNVSLKLHPATKTNEKTIQPDKPWEDATLGWFSVMDDGTACKMWYECYDVEGWPTSDDTSFCYAESTDGITWTKPSLNLFPYHDAQTTNILFRLIGPEGARSRVHGSCVFKDPTAPPEARYKAVSQGSYLKSTPLPADPPVSTFYRVAGMTSPDGIHWTRHPEPICTVMADSQYSCFWDESLKQYVLYGRANGRGRALGRTASADFTKFDPLTLVLETFATTPPDRDLYNPAAMKYPFAQSVYFMFPSLYNHETDTLDIRLAVSRDGIHWTWPEPDKPFIALGPAGAFDSGSLYMGQGFIRRGDELWQYYSGSPLRHNKAELPNLTEPGNARIYSRVITQFDRYVSADAGPEGGYFITPPLLFTGNTLHLNAEIKDGGQIRVGLIEPTGKPIDGYSLDESIPLTEDNTCSQALWKAGVDLSSLAGKPIRMRGELFNASVYAIQ